VENEAMIEGHGSQIELKGDVVIAGLVRGDSLERVAQETGVSVRTIKRWKKDTDFRARYDEAKREANEETTQRFLGARAECLTIIMGWVRDEEDTRKFRKDCIELVFAQSAKMLEGQDIAAVQAQLVAQVEMLKREVAY
jgi:hypothetical protein